MRSRYSSWTTERKSNIMFSFIVLKTILPSVVILSWMIIYFDRTFYQIDWSWHNVCGWMWYTTNIIFCWNLNISRLVSRLARQMGGGPRVVVSTAAFHARVRGSVPGLGGLKGTNNVSSPSTCESQYCGEPPWPRGSVLGLRPPGLEFRILCLEDSVISIISPSSGGSPGPV